MQPHDYDQFSNLLDAAYDLLGKTPAARVISPGSKALFFNAVKNYSLEQVSAALAAHCQEGTFTPVPNDIKVQIEKHQAIAWLSADEAWARLPITPSAPAYLPDGRRDFREAAQPPCLLNQVTAEALAVAQPLIDSGEDTAARMAFKAAYTRLVERAKLTNVVPKYFVSPGGTYEEQQAVIGEGVRMGLLPAPASAVPVQQLQAPTRTPGAKPDLKALLLSLQPKTMPTPEAKDYD